MEKNLCVENHLWGENHTPDSCSNQNWVKMKGKLLLKIKQGKRYIFCDIKFVYMWKHTDISIYSVYKYL